jgi:MSHA biogenesis protein MshP
MSSTRDHWRIGAKPRAGGFGALAAIIVLVVLATIAAAVVRLGASQSTGAVLDLQAARAYQAASAGLEWGAYQALKGSWTSCSNATHTTDLSADLGMHVTITCNSTAAYKDAYADSTTGAVQVGTIRVYTIDAVACNSSSCPDASQATSATYVERHRRVQVTDKFAP